MLHLCRCYRGVTWKIVLAKTKKRFQLCGNDSFPMFTPSWPQRLSGRNTNQSTHKRQSHSNQSTHKRQSHSFPGHIILLFWFFTFTVYNCIVPKGFLPLEIRLPSPGKACCNSHATQLTVHAGCFSVSTIHETLTWTPGSLLCTQM